MDFETIIFYALAVTVIVPAIMITVAKDIVRVAFWLLASLSGVAGMYVLLRADFMAVTQVMVYIGGILVLILFGIMMTQKDPILVEMSDRKRRSAATGFMVAVVLFGALAASILGTEWNESAGRVSGEPTTADLGFGLVTDYVLPFEIVSVLLLIVLCGSAYIARRREEEVTNA